MRYFFSVHDGVTIDDTEGAVHPSDEAAMAEARKTAFELLAEGFRRQNDRRHWTISVNDESGDLIGTVYLGELARSELAGCDKDAVGSAPPHR